MGCFRIEEIRDKDNETGLKEGGGIEMSNYSAFHIRDAPLSLSLLNTSLCIYLPSCNASLTSLNSRLGILANANMHRKKPCCISLVPTAPMSNPKPGQPP